MVYLHPKTLHCPTADANRTRLSIRSRAEKRMVRTMVLFRFYIFSLSNFLINLLSDSPTCEWFIYPDSPLHLSFRSGVAKKVRFCWELTTTCSLHYLVLNFFLWPCPIVSRLHHHLLSSYLARICLIVAFCPCLQDCPFNKKSSFSCRILKTWNSEYSNSTIVSFKSW